MAEFNSNIIEASKLNFFNFLMNELNSFNIEKFEINFVVNNIEQEATLDEKKVEQFEYVQLFHFLDTHFNFYYHVPAILSGVLYDKDKALVFQISFHPFIANNCCFVSFDLSILNDECVYYDATIICQEKLKIDSMIESNLDNIDKKIKI
jgi:hypothetical protein